jgi:hypothetical protein
MKYPKYRGHPEIYTDMFGNLTKDPISRKYDAALSGDAMDGPWNFCITSIVFLFQFDIAFGRLKFCTNYIKALM